MKKIRNLLIVLLGLVLVGCTTNTTPRYKVTFVDMDKSTVVNVAQGSAVKAIDANPQEGYEFLGWYYGEDLFDFSTIIGADLTLTAKYDLKELNVEFYVLDELVHSEKVKYNEKVAEYTPSLTEGKVFAGWMLDEEAYDFGAPVTKDLKLVAAIEEKLTVSFYNGDVLLHTEYVLEGEKVSSYSQKWPEHLIFNYWALDGEEFDFETPITSSIKLDANVTKRWSVSYYSDGVLLRTEYVLDGEMITEDFEPEKQYAIFLGWFIGNEPFDTEKPIKGDIILTANWECEKVTISFDSNGGSNISSVVIKKGSGLEITDALIPTKADCTFLGWYYNGKEVTKSTVFVTDATIVAKWGEKMYSISYDLNGGNWVREVLYPTREALVNAFLADASKFVGVTLKKESIHDQTGSLSKKLSDMFASNVTIPGESVTYKAKWAWFMNYMISVRTKDETTSSGVTYLKNLNDTYSNTYWRYELWAFLNETKAGSWPYSSDYSVSKNANGYYDVMPGEDIEIIESFSASTPTFKLQLPEKKYATFIGWYDQNGNLVEEVKIGTTGNLQLTAKYEDDVYNIVYYLDGGNGEHLQKTFKPADGIDITLGTPSKDGYAFMGFYLDSEFVSNPVLSISKGTAEDVNLYAKWAKEQLGEHLTISFYGDSISTYSGMIPSDATFYYPIYSSTVKHADKTWWRMACQELGLELFTNVSYSGSTVSGSSTSCGENDTRIAKLAKDGEAPDILVIYLGINDVVSNRSAATFKASYKNMINKIQAAYPNTQIFVCNLPYETYTDGSNPDGYNYPGLRESFNVVISEIAAEYSLPLIDLDKVITKETESMANRFYLGDNIHPSYEGMKVIKDAVVKKIKEFYNK